MLLKKEICFSAFFALFRGPGRAHASPYGPLWAHIDPKNLSKYIKVPLIKPFKKPITLPYVIVCNIGWDYLNMHLVKA